MEWRRTLHWLAEHRLAVFGFAVAVAYWPTMLLPAATLRWAAIAIGLALLCSLDPRKITGPMQGVLAFLFALAAISLIATPDIYAGSRDLAYILILCFAFILGAEQDSLDDLMTGIGTGLCASAMLALFMLSTPTDSGRDNQMGEAPTGLFFSSEVYAEFAAFVLVWAIVRRSLVIGAAAAVPLLLCNSRVAIVSVAIALIYAYWPARWSRRVMVGLGLVLLLIGLTFLMGAGKMASADHRLVLWLSTIMSIEPFGRGLGWFIAAHEAEEFAHSDALQMLVELGVGAAVVAIIPVMAFIGRRGTNAERALFVAVCVQVCISFPLHLPASAFLASVMAGYLAGSRLPVRVGERDGRPDDGGPVRRGNAGGAGGSGAGGRGGEPLPDRPAFANQAAVYPRPDCQHSGAARAIADGPLEAGRGF